MRAPKRTLKAKLDYSAFSVKIKVYISFQFVPTSCTVSNNRTPKAKTFKESDATRPFQSLPHIRVLVWNRINSKVPNFRHFWKVTFNTIRTKIEKHLKVPKHIKTLDQSTKSIHTYIEKYQQTHFLPWPLLYGPYYPVIL